MKEGKEGRNEEERKEAGEELRRGRMELKEEMREGKKRKKRREETRRGSEERRKR